jgi:glycosyltransferase 2 family protein
MSSARFRISLALICLALTFYAVDFSELIRTLQKITLPMIVALLVLAFIMVYLSAYKWRLLLAALHQDRASLPSSGRLFCHYLVGYFVNLIFPSYVAGDVVRSVRLGRQVGQVNALGAVILERYTGLLAMVILAFAFIWFIPALSYQIMLVVCAMFFAVIAGTVFALHPGTQRVLTFLPKRFAEKLHSPITKLQDGFNLVRKEPRVFGPALLLSFLFHSLTIVNTALAGYAIGWTDPMIGELFVVVPIILLIGAIPITPQGLGLQEGAFYYFLQMAGATPAQALGVAVVLRAKSYILALLGGVIWWFDKNKPSSNSLEEL